MKNKKNRKSGKKAKNTYIFVISYVIAIFFANKGIDAMMAMSPEEFWGMFDSKAIVLENTAFAAGKDEYDSPEPAPIKGAAPEPVNFQYSAKLTAYNSVPEQTDGNPCIAADGTDICKFHGCTVAQNGVKFGTKIEIEGYGVCEVHDRKNSRYGSEWIDIYFGGRDKVSEARAFGVKHARYRVIK